MTSKEALEKLDFMIGKSYKSLQYFWHYKESLDVIEGLVERDTPKKVIYEEPDIPKCPNCNSPNCTIYNGHSDDIELNFCDDCGQRLDWGD